MSGDANLVLTDAQALAAPAAGAVLASVTIPGVSADEPSTWDTGRWRVDVDIHQEGTVDTANLANAQLFVGTVIRGKLITPGNGNRHPTCFPVVYTQGDGTTINVKATATFAAASIVVTQLVASRIG